MRFAIACASLLMVLGCSSSRTEIQGFTDVRGLDLTKYAEEGFLITPERYDGEYDALGQIYVSSYPSANRYRQRSEHSSSPNYSDWLIDEVDTELVLDSLYNLARAWGADAIMNFRIETLDHPGLTGQIGEPRREDMSGLRVQGFAIRRK